MLDPALSVPSPSRSFPALRYRAWGPSSLRDIPQITRRFDEEELFAMEVVASVLPFKTNNYVVDELIDWDCVPEDPIFALTFPQCGMLLPPDFDTMAALLRAGESRETIRRAADAIRVRLNPHPAGQVEQNVPLLDGRPVEGVQHKYRETVLFFPSQGQTCHAYCSFCFRWPQFTGMTDLRFAARETDRLIAYLGRHEEVTDVLITGGDPLIMRTRTLAAYVRTLLEADLPHVQTIRLGTKALSYWPYRFLTDDDAGELLDLFARVVRSGRHLSLMAHFNHPRELSTPAVREAIRRIQRTGTVIRTQSPVLRRINDDPAVWSAMWGEQVRLACVPYYMFVVRDTGAQHYFGVKLARAWDIYRRAVRRVSGLARSVRGPSMSATPGKVHVVGVTRTRSEKVFVLQFLQGRNPDWVHRPFFASYDENAAWLDQLRPAFGGERFFWEESEEAAAG